jgi:hypothetical protein
VIAVEDAGAWRRDRRLRIPFGFGVTTLHELPEAYVRVTLDVNGTTARGVAADHLVPRWFSKDPAATPDDDVEALWSVTEHACETAAGRGADTVFDLWRDLYAAQRTWAAGTDHPPLVWGLGVSLVERAAIDAFCRATGTTFGAAVRENALGVRPGAVYEELSGADPTDGLPETPRSTVRVRHTVGFEDPLTDADVDPDAAPVDDGLPHTLAEVIDAYGVTHFKVKVGGGPEADRARLRRVAGVVEPRVADPVYTLDANEQYDPASLCEFWRAVRDDDALAGFREGLAFVEQPFSRASAFDGVRGALDELDPPVVVDESDDRPDALAEALSCGYAGTTHKNCKGVFKSLVNACLLDREPDGVLSAEDLTTVGPVALPQDLAVVATLGIGHAERNGHHYLRGLDDSSAAVQDAVLDCYPSLYRRHEAGFPTLAVRDGTVDVSEAVAAPFGVHPRVDRTL